MSRTFKDLPFWLWQAHRLNAPCPDPAGPWRSTHPDSPSEPRRWRNPAEVDAWVNSFPVDPAVRVQKARRKSQREIRRMFEGKYRAYVRDRIAHGDYDSIEAPEVITGYRWWW